jgi:hypothetical protein
MPLTINGIGTQVCGSRGDVGHGSYDAMEWVVILFMPILPIRAMHAFGWQGESFQMAPIRWSFDLVFRTFFSRWGWGLLFVGGICTLVGVMMLAVGGPNPESEAVIVAAVGAICLSISTIVLVTLALTGGRVRDIRRVMGPHGVGTADPATLAKEILLQLATTPPALGKATHAEAARELLTLGHYAEAMWSARLSVALEGQEGEQVTDAILADPGVRQALQIVRANPASWSSVMLSPEERRSLMMQNIQIR